MLWRAAADREIPVRVLRAFYTKFNVNPVWMMTGEGSP